MTDLNFQYDSSCEETDPNRGEKRQRIAQITFSFFNEKVINWLVTRGQYIQNLQFDKVLEIND